MHSVIDLTIAPDLNPSLHYLILYHVVDVALRVHVSFQALLTTSLVSGIVVHIDPNLNCFLLFRFNSTVSINTAMSSKTEQVKRGSLCSLKNLSQSLVANGYYVVKWLLHLLSLPLSHV